MGALPPNPRACSKLSRSLGDPQECGPHIFETRPCEPARTVSILERTPDRHGSGPVSSFRAKITFRRRQHRFPLAQKIESRRFFAFPAAEPANGHPALGFANEGMENNAQAYSVGLCVACQKDSGWRQLPWQRQVWPSRPSRALRWNQPPGSTKFRNGC